jgi:hypothetical protein
MFRIPMWSLFEKKPWVLTLSVLAVGAVTALAAGLGKVPFHEARPLLQAPAGGMTFDAGALVETWREIPLYLQAGVWMLIIMLTALIGSLLSPENRKRLLTAIFRIAVTYWLLYFLFTKYGDQLAIRAFGFLTPNSPLPVSGGVEPPPVFTPTQTMLWISYAVSLLIVALALIVSWQVYLFWMKTRRPVTEGSLKQLADIARSSLKDISAGRDSGDVIIQCYYRMNEIVADRRDLHRKDSMTPAEFALRLEQAGLPGDAVRRLTRLFESVRYGNRPSDQKAIREAVSCLNSILVYCGETV